MHCRAHVRALSDFAVILAWPVDDAGRGGRTRGYRVQFTPAIGPWRLRRPSAPPQCVNAFRHRQLLGSEQVFKNSSPACLWAAARAALDLTQRVAWIAEIMRLLPKLYDRAAKHISQV